MARRSSPKDPGVSQMYETGCSWRLHRIFKFRKGQVVKRLVSNLRLSNPHAIGNGTSRSRPGLLTIVDKKFPHNHFDVSSKRRSGYGSKSISCVKNNQEAAVQGKEATNMVVDQNFINREYLCKDGAGSQAQPNQFFDALQILYSNKQLFLRLLQDPNSILVKKIYDFKISQVKEQHQAGQKMSIRSTYESRWISSQKSYATQRETPCKYFDRYNISCDPQSLHRIVVLKPYPTKVQNFADAGCHCPLHSLGTYKYNAQTVKPSHFFFSHVKRKLRHAMGVRKKEQQWGTTDGVSRKFPCCCQGLEDGDKAIGLEGVGRISTSFAKAGKLLLDFKRRDKMMTIKDFTSYIGKGAVSVGETRGRNMTRTSFSPAEQNIQNIYVDEATKNLSEILNCRIEEKNNNELPVAIVKTVSDQLLCFGTNVRRNRPDNNLHAYYAIPIGSEKLTKSGYDLHPRESRQMDVPSVQESRNMDSPTQSLDMDTKTEGIGSVVDSPHETLDQSFSPEVASSCQSVDDPVNMRNTVDEHTSTESVVEQFIWEEVTNPTSIISQSVELPIQAVHDKYEEPHFADLVRSSSNPVNNLITSMDMSESDYDREIAQALSLKWDELVMKCGSPDQLLDQSTINELKGLTNQLSGSTLLFDCVMEVFMEIYQHFCRFPPHISTMKPNVQAYVLKRIMVHEVKEVINHHQHQSPRTLAQLAEKDSARHGSWLNVQVDTEDIAIEVEEDVLQALILEIVYEMDIGSAIHRYT